MVGNTNDRSFLFSSWSTDAVELFDWCYSIFDIFYSFYRGDLDSLSILKVTIYHQN